MFIKMLKVADEMPKKQYPEEWGKIAVPVPPFVYDIAYEEFFALILFVLFQLIMLVCIVAPYETLISLQNQLCAGLGMYYMTEHLVAIAIYDLAAPLAIVVVIFIPILSFYNPLTGILALLASSSYVLSYFITIMFSFEMLRTFFIVYAVFALLIGALLLCKQYFFALTKAVVCAFCLLIIINSVSPVDMLLYAHGIVYEVGKVSKTVIAVLFPVFVCVFFVYFMFTKEILEKIAQWRNHGK
ncbi:putative transporter [Trachipleistophora hominis]|uniref:Putative transporter n=1 Tax=Trachipleistophora hominis TaxID=72359 RepID=L7JUC9_TRAHO|nr:putative transporter [Trachipleistophora hominis]